MLYSYDIGLRELNSELKSNSKQSFSICHWDLNNIYA